MLGAEFPPFLYLPLSLTHTTTPHTPPLTHTHVCIRERARVVECGGVLIRDRLNGILAVSRAFGDREFKGLGGGCIASPEVIERDIEEGVDEFLVIACDGLWDVMTSQQAVSFVRRELLEGGRRGGMGGALCATAANKLVRKALDLGSVDNNTAVIVTLGVGGSTNH